MGRESKASEDAGYFLLALLAIIAAPFVLAYYALKWIIGGVFHILDNGVGSLVLVVLVVIVIGLALVAADRRDRLYRETHR